MLNNSGKKTQTLGVILFIVGIIASLGLGTYFYFFGAPYLIIFGLEPKIYYLIALGVIVMLVSVFLFSLLSYLFISVGKTDENMEYTRERISKIEKKLVDNNKIENEVLVQLKNNNKHTAFLFKKQQAALSKVNPSPAPKEEIKAKEESPIVKKNLSNSPKKCTLCAKSDETMYKILDKTGTKIVYLCPNCYNKWLEKYNLK